MAIAIVVQSEALVECAEAAARHLGEILNTGAQVIGVADLIKDSKKPSFDLYFCVTTGTDINFFDPKFYRIPWKKLAVWFVTTKSAQPLPRNMFFVTAPFLDRFLQDKKSWVFFAQFQDFYRSLSSSTWKRSSWLPPCADIDVYAPDGELKVFDACVVYSSNLCKNANDIIDMLVANKVSYVKLPYLSSPDLTRKTYNLSYFSIHSTGDYSMYNELDMPLSVCDSLANGVPVITNGATNLPKLFDKPTYLITYDNLDSIVDLVKGFKSKVNRKMELGSRARAEQGLNYNIRMSQAAAVLILQGVLPNNGQIRED